MDYQTFFYKKFYILIVILIIDLCAGAYFIFDKSDWKKYEFLKNNKVAAIAYNLLPLVIIAIYAWKFAIPIIQDKPYIDSNDYCVMEGNVYQEVVGSGLFGLSKFIIIECNDNNYEFDVVWADSNIKKDDNVKVTYLPNSKYAVVELE